jgi:hypothetical protein
MSTEISTQRAATGLALQSFDDAFRFAKMVAASEFSPKDFKGKPESCMLAIQHGSEVGLSPMQSLQSIAVINGRPTIWGDAALALVQASPVCEYVREYTEGDGDNLVAVCEAKRRGYPAPTISRFSVADAKKAGLWGKAGPWQQYPGRMMALRARGFALRNAFADALRGLITAEEAQDYPQAAPQQDHGPAGGAYAQFVKPQPEPVVVRPKFNDTLATETPLGKARILVSKATTVERLEKLRSTADERLGDGTFTRDEHKSLCDLIHGKLDILLNAQDSGTEHFDGQEVEAEANAR